MVLSRFLTALREADYLPGTRNGPLYLLVGRISDIVARGIIRGTGKCIGCTTTFGGNRTVDTKTGTANVYSAYNGADQLCRAGASTGTCATPPGGQPATATTRTGTPRRPVPPPRATTSSTSSGPTSAVARKAHLRPHQLLAPTQEPRASEVNTGRPEGLRR